MKTINNASELFALPPGTIVASPDGAIYKRTTGPDAKPALSMRMLAAESGGALWGDPMFDELDPGEYPLVTIHEPAGAPRSITVETFGQAAALPNWTVLRDPTETLFWVVRPDWQLVNGACRALVRIPAAASTFAGHESMNWLALTANEYTPHDPQEPLPDPLTVVSLPATPGDRAIGWADLWAYPPGSVFLDHSGDAWLRRDDMRGPMLECVGTLHTYRPHGSPRTGAFRPIYLPGQATADRPDPATLITSMGQFWQQPHGQAMLDRRGEVWIIRREHDETRAYCTNGHHAASANDLALGDAFPLTPLVCAPLLTEPQRSPWSEDRPPLSTAPTTDTVTTPQQLWALPVGTILADRNGRALTRTTHEGQPALCTERRAGTGRRCLNPTEITERGPYAVLHTPGTDTVPRPIITPGLFTQDAAVQVGSMEELSELQAGLTLKDAAGYEFRTVMTDGGAAPENNDEITDGTEITFPAIVQPLTDVADLFDLCPGTRLVDNDGGVWERGELGATHTCLIGLPLPGTRDTPMWVVADNDETSRSRVAEQAMPMRYAGMA